MCCERSFRIGSTADCSLVPWQLYIFLLILSLLASETLVCIFHSSGTCGSSTAQKKSSISVCLSTIDRKETETGRFTAQGYRWVRAFTCLFVRACVCVRIPQSLRRTQDNSNSSCVVAQQQPKCAQDHFNILLFDPFCVCMCSRFANETRELNFLFLQKKTLIF